VSRSRAAATTGADDFALWKKILLGLILVLVAMCLISVPMMEYGVVTGEEFSPARFHRRSYHYWEIPLVHVQITPLQKQDETNDLENYLLQKKLIRPANEATPRWDLVRLRRAHLEAPPGDALILCRYLDQKNDEGEFIWLEWSKKEPQLANVFWPAVAEAARREVYIVAPELFHLADSTSSPDDLKQKLADHLARQYEQLGRVAQQLGRASRAAEMFSVALRYDPKSSPAAEGRTQALQQLEAEKAQGDRAP
jgi:tetratricopeptide (TPR) repeat protein